MNINQMISLHEGLWRYSRFGRKGVLKYLLFVRVYSLRNLLMCVCASVLSVCVFFTFLLLISRRCFAALPRLCLDDVVRTKGVRTASREIDAKRKI